ncbi:MAG: HAD-IIA family hydrolase [Bacillota bacterium]
MSADNYDNLRQDQCFLLDMDGTFYLGDSLIDGAAEFLQTVTDQGKEYLFLTNNSSRNAVHYQEKLREMGIDVSLDRIVSSGEVTADYIRRQKPGARVYVAGTPSLEADLKQAGLTLVEKRGDNPDYAVLGFDTTLTYKKLWILHDLILEGVEYIATNPDFVCPLEEGRTMPDCGSMIELLEASTGERPLVIGKPNTLMIDYISQKTGIDKQYLCMVGDRLYTDIRTALEAGIDSVAVLTGEATEEDLEETEFHPDYVLASIKELERILGGEL